MIAKLEAVERAALEDMVAAAPADLATRLGIEGAEVGTAYLALAAKLPASAVVVNRTIGLGMGGPASREEVALIVRRYREAGVARHFLHLHPEARPAEIAQWCAAEGLERARAWVKFARGREAPPDAPTEFDIRLAGPAEAPAVGRIVAEAFDLGAAAAPWLAALVGRPGWRIYAGMDGDRPVGSGAMFVRDSVAYLDWGATAPAARGRGCQSALLRARVLDALDFGCELIATATGEEVAGDPQHSYSNILRTGFRPEVTRLNLAPPRPV